MRGGRAVMALAFALALAGRSVAAKDPPPAKRGANVPGAPVASKVVVRRQTSLVDAMRLVVQRTQGLGPTSGVAIVLDTTPAVKEAKPKIADALAALSSLPNRPTAWQVGPLGGSLSAHVDDPAALGPALDAALVRFVTKGKGATDTLGMLRRTVKHAAGAGGLVVYLAHAHFEDDLDLEDFIADLRADKRTLAVIGPEAAFERCWSDVIGGFESSTTSPVPLGAQVPGVGNSPFGAQDPTKPWHGGDAAYPLIPYRYALATGWSTTFTARAAERHSALERHLFYPPDPRKDPDGFDRFAREWLDPPDRLKDPEVYKAWLDRIGPPPDYDHDSAAYNDWFDHKFLGSAPPRPGGAFTPKPDPSESDPVRRLGEAVALPIPSGYGPYGLMRAAGATGGCYVLWGWTQGDAAPVRFDYGKCDLFPPDLRSRSEILEDLPRRPLAQALLQAWATMADVEPVLVRHSPPLRGVVPSPMTYRGGFMVLGIFEKPADRDEDVKTTKTALALIDRVSSSIEEAVTKLGDPKDDVDRRYRADAHLFLHVLETSRFHLAEYVLWSESLTKAAWRVKRSKSPYVDTAWWIREAEDDQPVTAVESQVKDTAAAAKLLSSRQAFLDRYRGTPYSAIVAKNWVWTYKLDVIDMTGTGSVDLPKQGKGSSTGPGGPAPPPAAGGSSGSPGPTTGGK